MVDYRQSQNGCDKGERSTFNIYCSPEFQELSIETEILPELLSFQFV